MGANSSITGVYAAWLKAANRGRENLGLDAEGEFTDGAVMLGQWRKHLTGAAAILPIRSEH